MKKPTALFVILSVFFLTGLSPAQAYHGHSSIVDVDVFDTAIGVARTPEGTGALLGAGIAVLAGKDMGKGALVGTVGGLFVGHLQRAENARRARREAEMPRVRETGNCTEIRETGYEQYERCVRSVEWERTRRSVPPSYIPGVMTMTSQVANIERNRRRIPRINR